MLAAYSDQAGTSRVAGHFAFNQHVALMTAVSLIKSVISTTAGVYNGGYSHRAVDKGRFNEVGGDWVQAGTQNQPKLTKQLAIEHSLKRKAPHGPTCTAVMLASWKLVNPKGHPYATFPRTDLSVKPEMQKDIHAVLRIQSHDCMLMVWSAISRIDSI